MYLWLYICAFLEVSVHLPVSFKSQRIFRERERERERERAPAAPLVIAGAVTSFCSLKIIGMDPAEKQLVIRVLGDSMMNCHLGHLWSSALSSKATLDHCQSPQETGRDTEKGERGQKERANCYLRTPRVGWTTGCFLLKSLSKRPISKSTANYML